MSAAIVLEVTGTWPTAFGRTRRIYSAGSTAQGYSAAFPNASDAILATSFDAVESPLQFPAAFCSACFATVFDVVFGRVAHHAAGAIETRTTKCCRVSIAPFAVTLSPRS